jgi:hypothetical protein
MKKLIRWYKSWSDRRLRERCVKYAIQSDRDPIYGSEEIMEWIKQGVTPWHKRQVQKI